MAAAGTIEPAAEWSQPIRQVFCVVLEGSDRMWCRHLGQSKLIMSRRFVVMACMTS